MKLNSFWLAAATMIVTLIGLTDVGWASCGGKGGKGGKHHRGGGVGVGVSADLGGVGQRKREADPFAVPHESSSSSNSSSSKRAAKKTKKPAQESGPGNVFSGVRLTGPESKIAKAERGQTTGRP